MVNNAPLTPDEVREVVTFLFGRENMKIVRDELGMRLEIIRGDQTVKIRHPRTILRIIRKTKEAEK